MKQLYLAIPILLSAASATAAPILVRSGEHGAFTRIVVDTDPSVDWQLQQDGNTATLQLPRNPDGFSTSGVFRRITRDRLQDISSDDRSLTLDLGCQCVVTATTLAPDYIILDIAPGMPSDIPDTGTDGSERPAAPNWSGSISATEMFFGLAKRTGDSTPRAETSLRETIEPAAAQTEVAPLVLPLLQDPAQRRPFDLDRLVPGDLRRLSGPEADMATIDRQSAGLTLIQDQLAREIGAAATQGLLTPAPDRPRAPAVTTDAGTDSADQPHFPEAKIDALTPPSGLPGNLRISSVSEDRNPKTDSAKTTINGLACVDDALFSVQDWGGEGDFGTEIARHRNALYGEFDTLDRNAQIALARAYVHFGFGAEALQIASLDVRDDPVDAAIMVIARLMDHGPGPKTGALTGFAACDGDVALWAILADRGQGGLVGPNIAAALRALNKLPYHLRSFLAPELSNRLRLHGDAAAAAQAMRSISRTPHEPESPAIMEQAEIDLVAGDDRRASEGFEAVIEENAFEAPQALIRFIDLQVTKDEAISKDTALLAEAYVAEHRGTELAPEITRVHMLALAKSGQFDAAFEVLANARTWHHDANALMTSLFEILQSDADNVTFLQRVLALTDTDLTGVSERTRLDLGERLLTLGFPPQADALIAQVDRNVAPREQQLLRGRIDLAMGRHRQALAASIAFDGEDFDRLRADAMVASGQFAQASEIYEALGDMERAASAEWNAPAGTVSMPPEDSSLARVSSLARRNLPETEGGLLARTGALLSDSSTLGADIEQLLADPELRIADDG